MEAGVSNSEKEIQIFDVLGKKGSLMTQIVLTTKGGSLLKKDLGETTTTNLFEMGLFVIQLNLVLYLE